MSSDLIGRSAFACETAFSLHELLFPPGRLVVRVMRELVNQARAIPAAESATVLPEHSYRVASLVCKQGGALPLNTPG